MSELSDSLLDAIRKRTTSAVFGTYLFFWLAFHWQGVYVALFVSEPLVHKKFGLLKNEYLERYFFGFHGLPDWLYYFGYIVPLLLTIIFIWPLPKFILIHFYRIEQEHKTDRMRIRSAEE